MNYRTILFSSACALALCAPHARAADGPVVEFDSVASFRDWSDNVATQQQVADLTSFHLASYYCASDGPDGAACPNDGGEGLFIQKSDTAADPAVCAVGLDDGGSVLVVNRSGDKYCFYRANLNGDIRQFGVTKGSDYDCSPGAGGVGDCDPITAGGDNRLGKLLDAVTLNGLHKVTLAGLQLRADHSVNIPDGVDFDLGGASPFATTDGLLDIPGTLFLAHETMVDMGEQTSIHNGLLLADFYTGIPETIPDQYHYRQAMVENADTGLRCLNKTGCTVHDMEVDGFDTGIEMRGAPHNTLTNVVADADVCFWASATGGNVKWNSTSCMPKINRGNDDEEVLPIDSIVDETTAGTYQHTCRVTLSSYSGDHIADVEEGFLIWGRGATSATGGTNINNRYRAHLTGTTGVIDLVGSACNGSDLDEEGSGPSPVTTTWHAGDRKLLASSIDHIQLGDTIAATGTAINGLHVAGIWKDQNIIILDTAPGTSGSGAAKFRGGAYNDTVAHCDPDATENTELGVCLVLDAAARVDAGNSDGGKKAGDGSTDSGLNNATGYLIGGPIPNHEEDDDSIAGFTASMVSSFGHSINFHVENSNETRLYAPASDAQGIYDDPNTFFAKVEGDSNNASFIGGKGGKAGTGLYVKLQDANECLNYVAANLAVTTPEEPQIDVESGCLIAEGVRPGGGNVYIAHDASNVSFPGSYMLKADFYYEDDTARGNVSTLGARLDSAAANNLINGNTDEAPAPMTGTDLQIVPPDSQMGRVLQDGFGGATSFTGRRANGTNASKTAVASGDVVSALEGSGYDGSAYTGTAPGGLYLKACENWSGSTNCLADVFVATDKGSVTPAEVARIDGTGLGVGTGASVVSPLEILKSGTTTTAGANLTSSATGSFSVGSTTGFPTNGVMLIGNEAIAYTVTGGSTVNIATRGVWGTTNTSHSSGDVVSYFALIDGSATNALPNFAVTSQGNIWWSGHTTTTGTAPSPSGTGAGSGATIAGNDNAGRLTVGSSPSGTAVTVNFATAWSNTPVCFGIDETTTTVNPILINTETKNLVQFKTAATPTAGDKISYTCTGYK